MKDNFKVGDTVELLPTSERNRHLRKIDGKTYWKVLEAEQSPKFFGGRAGVKIESVMERSHCRWVEPGDIKIVQFRENDYRD